MWGHMSGWAGGWGGPGPFGAMHLLWWVLVGIAVVVLARWLLDGRRRRRDADPDRALAVLRERFARGEIDLAEFEARKRALS